MACLNIADFFLDPDDSDITIRIQTEQDQKCVSVPGHRFVLRRSSNVFKTFLLSEHFKEGITKVLEIKAQGDIADGISFLRYLYTKNLKNLANNSYIALLQTAHLYDVKDLCEICEKRIRQTVTPHSVCKIYTTIENVVTEDCKKFLLDLMLKSAFLIFENQFHISLNEETLKLLLPSDQLNVLEEQQTIAAILFWAKTRSFYENNTNRDYVKRKTAELLPFVRWSFVENITEFSPWFNLIDGCGEVTGATEVQRTSNPQISLRSLCRVLKVTDGLISSNFVEFKKPKMCIKYSVNRDIFLVGIGLHVRTGGVSEEPFKRIEICVNAKAIDAYQMRKKIHGAQGLSRFIQIEFDKPVLMKNVGCNRVFIGVPKEGLFFVDVSGLGYKSESTSSHITKLTPDPDVVFTLYTEVNAIEELYYLRK